ncbi:MAG: N-formylglutamate amidohydrolase [Rhodovibrionaceae bacterium]|nr:N-formylglutamate amidohydrolase [Rhodovibrionaceae bacterium]
MNDTAMRADSSTDASQAAAFEVLRPHSQRLPLVIASPHSGRAYPDSFLSASRLDSLGLRRSEDSFVDELFAAAPKVGAPLIHALFPRAYVDPNREPFELDPAMFDDELPAYANTRSPRVAAGLGTIARVVASGAEIYRGKLSFTEALGRIHGCYWPYHTALRDLVQQTREDFGCCLLLDCHSMPSVGGPMDMDRRSHRVDIVLGDCHGTSCAETAVSAAENLLGDLGYSVTRNTPYSGGFVTRHYGRPAEGVHALQIELNRALYMDEERIERGPGLARVAQDMTRLMERLGEIPLDDLRP